MKKILISKKLLYHLYYEQGLTIGAVAEKLGVSHNTITNRMREYGFEKEPRGVWKGYLDPALLQVLYWEQSLTLKEIGEAVSRAPSNVMEDMKRAGIPRRQATARPGHHRGGPTPENCWRGGSPGPHHVYNEHFFDEWSPEMAWVLGLIFADGNIARHSKNGLLCTLSSIDTDMLEQVRRLIETDAPARKFKNRSAAVLHIASTETARLLCDNYGLHPNKSRTIQWPDVPGQCVPHFVRGLWDGDGCIFVRSRERRQGQRYLEVTSSYVSGSKEFVYDLRDTIKQHVDIPADVKQRNPPKHKPHWTISYYHRNSLKLLWWMYRDSTSLTRLARKFEKYIGVLQERD